MWAGESGGRVAVTEVTGNPERARGLFTQEIGFSTDIPVYGNPFLEDNKVLDNFCNFTVQTV
jgi:hypothetical protein